MSNSTQQFPSRFQSEESGEELIVRACRKTGLTAAISLDSTVLGPAAGGCRRWVYADQAAAIRDVERLSRGMTFKNALADIPFGGGKSVIMAADKTPPTQEQLLTFASWMNELGGRYVTAEDVGMGLAQMRVMCQVTPYVSGSGLSGVGGDPSPKTAYGVYLGLKAAVRLGLDRGHLYGTRVAVQGLGSVGMSLCHWLARAGAELVVADLDQNRVVQAMRKYDAVGVSVDEISSVDADVFAPCALGGAVDRVFAETTQFKVIAGAANNQLVDAQCGDILHERGVLYAPDFVVNAGGVISVAHEYMRDQGQFADDPAHDSAAWVDSRVDAIASRLALIVERARSEDVSTHRVAEHMAMEIIDSAASKRARAA